MQLNDLVESSEIENAASNTTKEGRQLLKEQHEISEIEYLHVNMTTFGNIKYTTKDEKDTRI